MKPDRVRPSIRNQVLRLLAWAVGCVLVLPARADEPALGAMSSAAVLASANFDARCPDGWTGTNIEGGKETLSCTSDDALGGSHLTISESAGDSRVLAFSAPTAFLGDKESAFGGYFYYRLRQIHTDQLGHGKDLRLRGSGFEIAYDFPGMPGVAWEHHWIPIRPDAPWYHTSTRDAVTEDEMRAVLRDLAALLVRAEFSSRQREVTDLDDFAMIAPGTQVAPSVSIRRVSHGTIDLSWPIDRGPWWLFLRDSVSPGRWTPVRADVVSSGPEDRLHARLAITGNGAWFRLQRTAP